MIFFSRFALRNMWMSIFEKFLNIPDCKSQPSWSEVNKQMRRELIQISETDILEWKKAKERLNSYFKFFV